MQNFGVIFLLKCPITPLWIKCQIKMSQTDSAIKRHTVERSIHLSGPQNISTRHHKHTDREREADRPRDRDIETGQHRHKPRTRDRPTERCVGCLCSWPPCTSIHFQTPPRTQLAAAVYTSTASPLTASKQFILGWPARNWFLSIAYWPLTWRSASSGLAVCRRPSGMNNDHTGWLAGWLEGASV